MSEDQSQFPQDESTPPDVGPTEGAPPVTPDAPPAAAPPPLPPEAPDPAPEPPPASPLPLPGELPRPSIEPAIPEVRIDQFDPPPSPHRSPDDGGKLDELQARIRTPIEFEKLFTIKITGGNTSSGHNWIEQVRTATSWANFTDGRQASNSDGDYKKLLTLPENSPLDTDRRYPCLEVLNPDTGFEYVALVGSGNNYVRVKRNGGSDGNLTTYASYTYDIYALSDVGLVTKLNGGSPLDVICGRCRQVKTQVNPASDGSIATFVTDPSDASMHVFDCAEFFNTKPCTNPP